VINCLDWRRQQSTCRHQQRSQLMYNSKTKTQGVLYIPEFATENGQLVKYFNLSGFWQVFLQKPELSKNRLLVAVTANYCSTTFTSKEKSLGNHRIAMTLARNWVQLVADEVKSGEEKKKKKAPCHNFEFTMTVFPVFSNEWQDHCKH